MKQFICFWKEFQVALSFIVTFKLVTDLLLLPARLYLPVWFYDCLSHCCVLFMSLSFLPLFVYLPLFSVYVSICLSPSSLSSISHSHSSFLFPLLASICLSFPLHSSSPPYVPLSTYLDTLSSLSLSLSLFLSLSLSLSLSLELLSLSTLSFPILFPITHHFPSSLSLPLSSLSLSITPALSLPPPPPPPSQFSCLSPPLPSLSLHLSLPFLSPSPITLLTVGSWLMK